MELNFEENKGQNDGEAQWVIMLYKKAVTPGEEKKNGYGVLVYTVQKSVDYRTQITTKMNALRPHVTESASANQIQTTWCQD